MIHVDLKPEPSDFDINIRKKGQRFLSKTPCPTNKQWKNHSYWRKALKQIHNAYNGICAYSCHWIPFDTGSDTIDHFMPKSTQPLMAYEWENFRLVCGTLNGRKGIRPILDPFQISTGWFVLDFPSLLVKSAENIDPMLASSVNLTCITLGLNDEGSCLKARIRYIRDYCKGYISFEYLRRDAPFIANEIERQGLITSLPNLMQFS